MRESRPYGSERGAFSNGRPYRDRTANLSLMRSRSPVSAEAVRKLDEIQQTTSQSEISRDVFDSERSEA